MRARGVILALFAVSTSHSFAEPPKELNRCPVKIEVAANGDFFTHRFNGRYKTSVQLLTSDLKGGCYNDSSPAPVSSVTLKIVAGAPKERVARLYRVVEQNGWPKSRVIVER